MTDDNGANGGEVTVAALYHFLRIDDPQAQCDPLRTVCIEAGIRGTLLLAREGINGTIAGKRSAVLAVIAHLRDVFDCPALEWKESRAAVMPFRRMKVRPKQEIVTMGEPEVDPRNRVGRYVAPAEWNALIAREDVALIDTRNDYEVAIGTFEGAVDPQTTRFRDFPDWWRENGGAYAGKTVAMFCTGGIRCEKATSWLIGEGVAEVVHLRGGILKYLEEVPEAESRWQGECFVFDQRVAVGHGLTPGAHVLCHACRRPVSPEGTRHADYCRGVSCASCIGEFTDADRARFAERQDQMDRAEMRGEDHLGRVEPAED